MPQLQRRALAQHPRARRRVEQLGRGHPLAHRTGAHHPAGGTLLGLHHRRGPHALGGRLQRLPQDARGAARTRHLHPGDHRKTQDHPYDPLPLPDLRLQPHPRRGLRGIPQIHRLAGGNHRRRRVAQPDRTESRRRHARRPVDVRQGRFVLRAGTPLSGGGPDAQRIGLRHLLQHDRDAPVGQLCRGAALFRQRARTGILRPDFHGGTQPPPARPAGGPQRAFAPAAGIYRYADGTIPDAGGRLPSRISFRRHIAAHGPRRQNQAIVQPTAARRTGTDEDRRSRSKKK